MEFHENGILTGVAGSLCLLCEKYITKTDLTVHIANSDHKERLALSAYLDRYKDDRIRKVKMGYYCEPCNILLQTISKVGIHVGDTTHDKNKTCHLVREVNKGFVAFDDILIERRAWNGQNVESCYVCNVEFSDERNHSNESSHILNVIQSKLELKRGKYVYRKVDDAVLNCLICNSLITVDSKESHAEDSDHTNNFIKCQNNYKKFKVHSAHTSTQRVIIPTKTESRQKNGEEMNRKNMKLDFPMDNCNHDGEETDKDNKKTESDCQKVNDFQVQSAHTVRATTDTVSSDGVNGGVRATTDTESSDGVNAEGVRATTDTESSDGVNGEGVRATTDTESSDGVNAEKVIATTDTESSDGVNGEGVRATTATESSDGVNAEKVIATTDTESSDKVNGEGTKADSKKLDVAMENCNVIVSPQEALKSAMQFAKANHLKYKRNNTYCNVCNVMIPSSLLRMKEHVAEKMHQEKAAGFSKVANKQVLFSKLFDSHVTVTLFTHNIIINEKFFLSCASYQTISQRGVKFRCQICEVSMQGKQEVYLHANMWEHFKGILQASVLTTFNNEFVREIRSGVYHCGFCNIIEDSMASLKNHLKSGMHGVKKTKAQIRL